MATQIIARVRHRVCIQIADPCVLFQLKTQTKITTVRVVVKQKWHLGNTQKGENT